MALAQRIEARLKRHPVPYAVIAPVFYFLQFLYQSIKQRSVWAYRYYPGHYGSPIPSLRAVRSERRQLFDTLPQTDDGVDLNQQEQERMLEVIAGYFPEFAPPPCATVGKRYFHDNPMFGFADGSVLFGMLRSMKPARVIEIGSGFSSALMIDTAERYLPDCRFTFIDPYSSNLIELLGNEAPGRFEILREPVQEVSLDVFRTLEANDILFVDSSHVVKIGSDLSTIFFTILPALKKGVVVHVHDIWYPFEYPESMVMEGRAWNEIYFLRAFLQYNRAFEIVFFNSYVEGKFRDRIASTMPGYPCGGGNSLWLRKIA